jgi:hypothetical protein
VQNRAAVKRQRLRKRIGGGDGCVHVFRLQSGGELIRVTVKESDAGGNGC